MIGKKEPIWFYTEMAPKPGGCWYYRAYMLGQGLEDSGEGMAFFDETMHYPAPTHEDNTDEEYRSWTRNRERTEAALLKATVVQNTSRSQQHMRFMQRLRKARQEANDVPVLVYDKDDLDEYVHPTNPAFRFLGTRSPDGTPLNKGDQVAIGRKTDGKPIVLYVDGHHGFDIERNHVNIQQGIENAKFCDVVTVTSQELADYYREQGCEHVFIRPNAIRFEDYHTIRLEQDDTVRILWQGGTSHIVDWYEINEAVVRVVSETENVKLLIWGDGYREPFEKLPKHKVEFISYVPVEAYLSRLCGIGHDINLAPLDDTRFNRAKSAIKWYEASAIPHHPAVTIARNIPPYTEITNGQNGLLYDTIEQFEVQLRAAIADETLRKRLAMNAQEWVKANRDHRDVVRQWADYMREQIERVNPRVVVTSR